MILYHGSNKIIDEMSNDMQFMVEILSTELIEMLISTYNWDLGKSIDVFYCSETFRKLCDPETGLYFQGPVYVFSFLQNEIETGRVA